MEANNDAKSEELCDLVYEKTEIKVSRSTMGRITQKLDYTFKKKTMYAAEKKRKDVQEKRVDYWEKARDIDAKDLIFVDESGVNLAMTRTYGRSLRGERVRVSKPQKRGKNISLIGALSNEKVVAVREIYGAVNGITFEAFIIRNLVPKLW